VYSIIAEPSLAETRDALDMAIDQARHGVGAASSVARAAAARFPGDVTVLHKAGVIEQLLGHTDAALGFFHGALEILPDFAFSELEIGSLHAQRGERQEALRWLRLAATRPETAALASLRAAAMAHELARHGEALAILARAAQGLPGERDVVAAYGQQLIYHDRRREAACAYAGIVGHPASHEADEIAYLTLLSELGDYGDLLAHAARLAPRDGSELAHHRALLTAHARMAQGHDRAHVLGRAQAREGSPGWLAPRDVLARLQAAIAAREPLSLVRFGDGEARFLAAMDASLNPALEAVDLRTIGGSIWRNWFGTALEAADPAALAGLHAATLAALESADILGLPTHDRLWRDHLHFGYLATLERQIERLAAPPPCFTDAWIAALLHSESPFYRALLNGLDSITVISPHPGLAAHLAFRHDIADSIEHLVPGETRLPPAARGATGPHFPDAYEALLAGLRVPRRGAMVLVAAGLLGKIYCARIKALGGIAIDIGSLADAWQGHDTRPGLFPDLAKWRIA
jgi:hypothetical protein